MALPLTLLLLNILNFVLAIIVIGLASSSRKLPSVKWMLILVVCFCVVSFCTLGVYISRDFTVQITFHRMRFLALGLLPPCWFIFICSIYGKSGWIKRPKFLLAVFIPGIITTICTLIPVLNKYILEDFTPIVVNGFSVLKFHEGSWFPFHYISAMTLVLMSILAGALFFFRESSLRRRQIIILVASSSLAAGVDIYCVLTKSPLRWLLLSSGTFIFCQLGIVFASWKLNLLNFIPLAIDRVFREFPDPVIVVDNERKIRAINDSATLFFDLHDSIGKDLDSILPHISLTPGEFFLKDNKGEGHSFNLTVENLETSGNGRSGQIFFFREITAQKSIESRLNENIEFKARLLALISHDLAGQIESQALIMSSFQNKLEDSDLQDKVELMASSSSFSQGFIENIMTWVKGQGSNFEIINKNFEWNILIRECIEELEYAWKPKKVSILFQSSEEHLVSEGDSNMIGSIVRNVLSNAIRANSIQSGIEIILYKSINQVVLTIKDSGIGMSDEQLSSVLSSSADFSFRNGVETQFKSYGIGLKMVRYFIRLHGGKFDIESQSGLGTIVTIRIPISQKPGQ